MFLAYEVVGFQLDLCDKTSTCDYGKISKSIKVNLCGDFKIKYNSPLT